MNGPSRTQGIYAGYEVDEWFEPVCQQTLSGR